MTEERTSGSGGFILLLLALPIAAVYVYIQTDGAIVTEMPVMYIGAWVSWGILVAGAVLAYKHGPPAESTELST